MKNKNVLKQLISYSGSGKSFTWGTISTQSNWRDQLKRQEFNIMNWIAQRKQLKTGNVPTRKVNPKIERKKKKKKEENSQWEEWLNWSASIHQSVFIRYFLPNYIKRRGGYCFTLFTSEIVRLTPLINPLTLLYSFTKTEATTWKDFYQSRESKELYA